MLPKSGPNRTSSRYVGQALKAEAGRDDTSREPSISSNIAMQCVSRRKIFSLVGGAAAVGLADSLDLGQRDAAKLDYFCGVPGKQFTNLGDRR
jgi:hypothetical protein